MATRSRDVPDEELFMSRPGPAEDCDSPTVEPLRIFKPASPKPAGTRFQYPAPPTSSSSSAASSKPTFPLPPGASSSAAPLPYPEDLDERFSQPPKPSGRLPYPDDGGRKSSASSGGRTYTPPTQATAGGARTYNDTSPRLNMSPVEKKGTGLAERRGTAPKPLSPTSPDDDDRDELFAKPLAPKPAAASANNNNSTQKISTAYQNKPYYPPPGGANSLALPGAGQGPGGLNRFSSTASTSTTKASRGSPPPPETPIAGNPGLPGLPGLPQLPQLPGGDIADRYAAAGISGTATLNSFNAPSAAQQSRLAQYGGRQPAQQQQQQQQAAPARPWTPTESPDQTPHGPPIAYQGSEPVASPKPQQTSFNLPPNPGANPAASGSTAAGGTQLQVSVLEQDFQRMQASTPPPAYSTVPGASAAGSSYPSEKQRPAQQPSASSGPPGHPALTATAAAAAGSSSSTPQPSKQQTVPVPVQQPVAAHEPHITNHPAFASDQKQQQQQQQHLQQQQQQQQQHAQHPETNGHPATALTHTPSLLQAAASPPPLPEGWIAHLDQNSGQYYYIHLATQATQWEFPKGPVPLGLDPTPLSPTASTYGNPLGSPFLTGGGKLAASSQLSPGLYPQTPGGVGGYAESIMSVAASATPSTALGFTGPPPSAGVDVYKVAPTNGVYFGPYLRYVNMDLEKGLWLGSIMIVTDAPQPPTIHIHLSQDLSPNPQQLMPHPIFTHQRWGFYKYDVALPMGAGGTERWTYAVTSHLGCTRYEFVVAGRHETGWRMAAHSGNDFAPGTSQGERAKLGGVGMMWKDMLQRNVECGGFHVQLGLGGQVYADRLWREVPILKQWLAMQGRENRKNTSWTARHEEDVSHAYFHYYTSHFDQPFLREAFAQIPHVLQIDDHDIFDGFGSYPDYMQQSAVFKNIGRIAIEMYLLFQHHTTVEMLRNVSSDLDLFTITGAGWHFVKYLGPAVVVVGPDCRSERTQSRVLAGPTYQGVFPKVALLPPSVQHCIWMVSVPVVYPRLEAMETLVNTFATGKKAVNTTYNILGKVTSSVAGVVGGKDVVAQGFTSVKKAVGKSGLMGNVLNQFGEVDIGEELKDSWTHESKDLERTYLIRTLQGIAHQKGVRMTFLSGHVNAAGAGLVHDPTHPSDHKTMYQIITSPVVAAPAGQMLVKLLHNNKLLYVPQNAQRSTHEVSDTKEDMMEIFHTDASGSAREYKKLMNRRNYVAIVAYDPEAVGGGTPAAGGPGPGYAGSVHSGGEGGGKSAELSKLSLAVDFVVQGDGGFGGTTKYGPVIVPHLEFGH